MTTEHKPDDGGPAFPPTKFAQDRKIDGLTIRDYFAAKALAGLLAGDENEDCESEDDDDDGLEREWVEYAEMIAHSCYRYADAMLAARSK